jgi:PAS domain-containing protein
MLVRARIEILEGTHAMVEAIRPNVRLHVFPSDDADFRAFALDQLASLAQPDPERLQSAIRRRYPLAIVRVRSPLAEIGGAETLWYAFRRGTAAPQVHEWWVGHDAWAILDEERRLVEVSGPLAAIVEVPPALMVSHRVEDFANPDDATAADDVAALWAELLAHGRVDGSLRFNRVDGTPREIDYHVEELAGGEARRYRAFVRERYLTAGE